jgi:hypothetical protein
MHNRLRYAWKLPTANHIHTHELMRRSGPDYPSAAHHLQRDEGKTSQTIEAERLGIEDPESAHTQSKRTDGSISVFPRLHRERKW